MASKKDIETELLQEHLKVDAARLDRIEDKIDKLSETVISLARAEEKLIALEADRESIHRRLNNNEEAILKIDKKVTDNAMTVNVINRLFWIVLSVAAAGFVSNFLMK